MKYIDIHCHLNLNEFSSDQKEVIGRAREKEVGMIVVGTDLETSKKAVEIANKYENIWATVGLHPNHQENFDLETYIQLAKNHKVVGIGECGLDYFRSNKETIPKQKEIFEKHIEVANRVKKPLMLHIRDAYPDALEIIKNKSKVSGNVHCFTGDWPTASRFLDIGFRLSFTGIITFARDYDEVVKNIPLDKIMSETDAPFLTPSKYRGKRNEPMFVTEVAHKIADLRGGDSTKTLTSLVDNARKLFSI